VHISGKGKTLKIPTFELFTFEPPSFITKRESDQRKFSLFSINLLLFRKTKSIIPESLLQKE